MPANTSPRIAWETLISFGPSVRRSNRKVRALTTRAATTIVRSVGRTFSPRVRVATIGVLMWSSFECGRVCSRYAENLDLACVYPTPSLRRMSRGQCPLLGRTICPTSAGRSLTRVTRWRGLGRPGALWASPQDLLYFSLTAAAGYPYRRGKKKLWLFMSHSIWNQGRNRAAQAPQGTLIV